MQKFFLVVPFFLTHFALIAQSDSLESIINDNDDRIITKYNPNYLVRSRCTVIICDVIRLRCRIAVSYTHIRAHETPLHLV